MRSPRYELIALVALAANCREPESIKVDAPSDIAAVAVLLLDAEGAPIGNAELLPWNPDEALPITASADQHPVLAGYTREQLAIYFGDQPPAGSVRAAIGCEPKLPTPAWFARWTKTSEIIAADKLLAPALTADFAENKCPDLSGALVEIELRCTAPRCPSTPVRPDSCRQQLDLSACGLGFSELNIDARGVACIEPATLPNNCQIDVYIEENVAQPPFAQKELRFFGEEIYVPERTALTGAISPIHRFQGRAYDFVVLDDHVVVTASPDGTVRSPCPDGQPAENETLYFVDPETVTTVTTTTAPRCLQRMVRDGDGFLASFARTDTWSLGRFDANGRLLDEASLELPFEYRRVEDLALFAGDRVLVLVNFLGSGTTLLKVHDRATLDLLDTIEIRDFSGQAIVVIDTISLALMAANDLSIVWISMNTRMVTDRQDVPPNLSRNWAFFGGALDPRNNLVLVAARGEAEMYRFRQGGSSFERARLSGGEGAEMSLVPWPLGEELWLAGGTNAPDFDASVTLFDAKNMRFLPGRWVIGEGIVGRMHTGAAGKIWALLPWAGKLIRVSP